MNYKISFCAKTDKGLVRDHNEDNYIIDESINFMAIADGMGGHKNGELASKIAIEKAYGIIKDFISSSSSFEKTNKDYSILTNKLLSAFDVANNEILVQSKSDEKNKGMGTTLTAVILNDMILSLVHIGDSRAYIIRDSKIKQISDDHSFVMEQYKKGIITLEEAERSPYRNVLTRALGVKDDVEYFVCEEKIKKGDIILLATDGLTKMVKDEKILEIVSSYSDNTELICSNLILEANKNGGDDNITVAVAKIDGEKLLAKIKKRIKKWILH
ncbi:MAG: Stp1/IreP family PP2C-type Ser/Thr phosphatase [Elusimicrobiales bacterium]|nr:Stp1/IreP family PP2C-type Ser/Thr phosphatase [Elusimicrobiales bacterium]NLH39090.1 Stp1/IreP family PP2C-type Ser/Thr phosphatase [Elusimicrobiota bacterium]